MNSRTHYEVAIIGAGLAGLAAGIRVAHFGKRVCIFERHNAPGGLNSFYSLDGRKYDVGLHAVTNYVRPGVKGTALVRLMRQLRIERDQLALCEQRQSRVAFGPRGEATLRFTNDFEVVEAEVARLFPAQIDGFRRLTQRIRDTGFTAEAAALSARAVFREYLSDRLLEDLLLCPLMFYGSAREHDMDFGQAALLFHAIFLEGLARPLDGVRPILRLLLDKYRAAGGERRMKCGVRQIIERGGRAAALILDSGEEITADQVLSTIGGPETAALIVPPAPTPAPVPGSIAYVETITVMNCQPAELGWGQDSIVFFNDSAQFTYAQPEVPVDVRSGVICLPNNFDYPAGQQLPEGLFRVTCLAPYRYWRDLPEAEYRAEKSRWFPAVQASARRFFPAVAESTLAAVTIATDMYTPRTVERFTSRRAGAIYGSPEKALTGRTSLANVHLCGTDQGLLGIVGAMLSGVLIANQQVLQKGSG